MCCWTHKYRDQIDRENGVEFTLAHSGHFRCRCEYGMPCERQQVAGSGPVLMCEWCRSENHDKKCDEINRHAGLRSMDSQLAQYRQARAAEYYESLEAYKKATQGELIWLPTDPPKPI